MATTKPKLFIIGAGGHAKVVADCAELLGYDDIAMLDDHFPDINTCGRWPVVGKLAYLNDLDKSKVECFVAIGNNPVRATICQTLLDDGWSIPTLIHPTAVIARDTEIGVGTLVLANVVVNSFSSVGKGCILNTACSVDHDCTIGNFVHIAPGTRLAGGVSVGDTSFIGIGCAVIQQVTIGVGVTIGAGSTVLKDITDNVVAVGSPAVIKK
ncbi:acetyltransferase [Alteromonas facilis]|uniref:acetyltransferase n=1 Tax=Alteromonas facilis TaxID=2048004 RepID=UPI000C28A8F8|nr:acetyltransferase [Alteromonas facilis]